MKILHLSDLHIGVGKNYFHAKWIVSWIMANLDWREHIILITGDLVDSPSAQTYRAAAGLIEEMRRAGFSVLTVPGNHDIHYLGLDLGLGREVGRAMWREWIDPVSSWNPGDTWPKTFDADGVKIIGVDTNAGTSGDWIAHTAQGEVGETQLGRLSVEVQDTLNVILGHHKLFWREPWHKLLDAAEVLEIIRHRTLGWVCGHKHEQARHEEDGILSLSSRRSTQIEDGVLKLTSIDLVEGLPDEIVDVELPKKMAA